MFGLEFNLVTAELAKLGVSAVYFDAVDSTSREAYRRAAANTLPAYSVVFAESQSDGYGKRGRRFFSPVGGVYFSIILPDYKQSNQIFETTQRAVKVMKNAVETLFTQFGGADVTISGNDLFLRGKKICGIITEAYDGFAVLGIGVNLFGTGFEGLPNAGAVFDLCEAPEETGTARERLIITAVKLLLAEFAK